MNHKHRNVVIVGAGGVLGEALCREFSSDASVLAVRRPQSPAVNVAGVQTVNVRLDDVVAMCDVIGDFVGLSGTVDLMVHNAARLQVAPFDQLPLYEFEAAWRAAVGSALAGVRAVLPYMRARSSGNLLFCGATASLRGTAGFAAFSSAKFALRGLVQSLARELHPQGIHVAHLVLDGLLSGSAASQRLGGDPKGLDDAALAPEAVAQACRVIIEQHRSAWSHEIDLRPWKERF